MFKKSIYLVNLMVIQITISNRAIYTFLLTIGLVLLGTGVYAVSGVSHSWEELANLPEYATRWASWSEISGIPSGFADGVDDKGITSESDPTVPNGIKDGISWSEISGRPAGLDNGDDYAANTNAQTICGNNKFLDGDGQCHGYVLGTQNMGEDTYGALKSSSSRLDTCGTAGHTCGNYLYECKPTDNFECNDAYDYSTVQNCDDDSYGKYARTVVCRVPKILV